MSWYVLAAIVAGGLITLFCMAALVVGARAERASGEEEWHGGRSCMKSKSDVILHFFK